MVPRDARSFRCAHDRSISGRSSVSPLRSNGAWPGAVAFVLALTCRTVRQMPKRAKVALIDVQYGPRIDLAHICSAKCLLLGAKDGLWRPVRPPVRADRPDTMDFASCASRSVLPPTHGSILVGDCRGPCHRGVLRASTRPVLPKVPRRAPIRRRGKRGRIWRAGATKAYENRTQLTNDACNLLPGLHTGGGCRSRPFPQHLGRVAVERGATLLVTTSRHSLNESWVLVGVFC